MRARVIAGVALVSCSACTLLTDLDGLSVDSSAAPDGGDSGLAQDAAVADGPPVDVLADAADGAASDDARSDGGPCSEELLVGNRMVEGAVADPVGRDFLDTYGYDATRTGVASCVWVYIDAALDRRVVVGVYGDASGEPSLFLAEASVTRVVKGWNAIPLSEPVNVEGSKRYWIGVNSPDGSLPDPCTPSGDVPAPASARGRSDRHRARAKPVPWRGANPRFLRHGRVSVGRELRTTWSCDRRGPRA
ncbi:MAG: hypothetical protein U0270_10620 [Labilithrix sp.]